MEILTSVKRLYIRFKSLVNDFVYSFGHAALLLLVEAKNHTVTVRERRRIRVKYSSPTPAFSICASHLCRRSCRINLALPCSQLEMDRLGLGLCVKNSLGFIMQ